MEWLLVKQKFFGLEETERTVWTVLRGLIYTYPVYFVFNENSFIDILFSVESCSERYKMRRKWTGS